MYIIEYSYMIWKRLCEAGPPLSELHYIEAEALAIYEEGKAIGYYEHKIGDDLEAVRTHGLEGKVEDYKEKITYFVDKDHEYSQYQYGR